MKYKLLFDPRIDAETKKVIWKLLNPTVTEVLSECEGMVPNSFYFNGSGRNNIKVDKNDMQYFTYQALRDLWVQSYIDMYRNVVIGFNEDGTEWIKYSHVHKDAYVDLPENEIITICLYNNCTVEFIREIRFESKEPCILVTSVRD